VDSGFRGGTDIVKALVMGAQAVAGGSSAVPMVRIRFPPAESPSLSPKRTDLFATGVYLDRIRDEAGSLRFASASLQRRVRSELLLVGIGSDVGGVGRERACGSVFLTRPEVLAGAPSRPPRRGYALA
jgi:hypothetical protein